MFSSSRCFAAVRLSGVGLQTAHSCPEDEDAAAAYACSCMGGSAVLFGAAHPAAAACAADFGILSFSANKPNVFACSLQTGLRALPASFGAIFGKDSSVQTAADIRDTAKRYSGELRDRAAVELPLLPFSRYEQHSAFCSIMRSMPAQHHI